MCEQTSNLSKQVTENARHDASSSSSGQTRGMHHHSIFGFRCNCDECKGLKREVPNKVIDGAVMMISSGYEDQPMEDTKSVPTVATCSKGSNNHKDDTEAEEEEEDKGDDDKEKSEDEAIDEPMPQQRQLETKPTALIAPFATTLELDDQESNITQVDSEIQNIARSIQFNLSNGVLLSDSDDTQQSANNNNPSPVPPNSSDLLQVQANASSIGEEQLQTPVTRKRLLSNASELKRPTLRRNTNQFNQF